MAKKILLSIIEIGGYPDFSKLYQEFGYEVIKIKTMRKALSLLKKTRPDIIVAEFIFGPKYSTFISNLDSLFAMIAGKYPDTKLILFVDKAEDHHLEKLRQHYALQVDSLFYPIEQQQLRESLI
ncbi:hypothetical protein THIOM_005578 [Candidatus Thiomargarita nelsonii]|uniref:Response regulatory domain-containing protein n=1 Tax=Candidatus Thiomargarita nelsonii TaxID=1003181 RepID=A0A176RSW7_9GAMM|nr:hypothetical protein THIOM_005578 [Candidatus Thiomargarita nelsonii]